MPRVAQRVVDAAALLTILAALVEALLGTPADAAEIRVLSAAAMQSVLKQVTGGFERNSGHRLIIDYGTMGAIHQRVLGGETADLIIGSTDSMSNLMKEGRIRADSQITVCKVGVGIVVPSGTPNVPMRSIEDLKRALLAAKTIVYAEPVRGGAAGIHIARVIEQLGLAEQLKTKTVFGGGGDVTEVTLAQGDGALGMTQISEIVEKPGADFVGPLPDAVQNYTGVAAGIPIGAARSEAVVAFMEFLKSPTAVAVIRAKGMEIK
jgi:molybdate transport system substrate-binding protein